MNIYVSKSWGQLKKPRMQKVKIYETLLSIYHPYLYITIYLSLIKTKNVSWWPLKALLGQKKVSIGFYVKKWRAGSRKKSFFMLFLLRGSKKNISGKRVRLKPVFRDQNRLERDSMINDSWKGRPRTGYTRWPYSNPSTTAWETASQRGLVGQTLGARTCDHETRRPNLMPDLNSAQKTGLYI